MQFNWLHRTLFFTWHSDLALRAPDRPPGFAQGHQRCSLGRLLLPCFLLARWLGPCTSPPCVAGSPRLPRAFAIPTYDGVLQQLPGTHSPACVQSREVAGGVRAIRWGVIRGVGGVGVRLHGGFSRGLGTASRAVVRGNGDVDHVVAEHRWVKDLGETTEGADWGTGGQGGGRGVGIRTLVGRCRTSVGYCRQKSEWRGLVFVVWL